MNRSTKRTDQGDIIYTLPTSFFVRTDTRPKV